MAGNVYSLQIEYYENGNGAVAELLWIIPLQAFANQGMNLGNVDRIAIGLGTKGYMTIPGGSGKMYFDDIRLYRPRSGLEE